MTTLAAICLAIGFVGGATSVGGVLMIPLAEHFSGLPLRTVMGTVLAVFFIPSIVGTLMHSRAGNFRWRSALPLCLGAAGTALIGALAKDLFPLPVLKSLLAVIIILSGLTALVPLRGLGGMASAPAKTQDRVLFLIGALVGLFSGLTGSGGPVLSVPLMLILGYPPILSIAIAAPFQIMLSLSGSIGNILVADVDFRLWLWMTVPILAGSMAGIHSLRYFNPKLLKVVVSLICIATGTFMLYQTLG